MSEGVSTRRLGRVVTVGVFGLSWLVATVAAMALVSTWFEFSPTFRAAVEVLPDGRGPLWVAGLVLGGFVAVTGVRWRSARGWLATPEATGRRLAPVRPPWSWWG